MNSLKVCVSSCPNRILNTTDDLINYSSETGNSLCFYDVPLGSYNSMLCPTAPLPRTFVLLQLKIISITKKEIFFYFLINRTAIANRCIPNVEDILNQELRFNQRIGIDGIRDFLTADYFRSAAAQLYKMNRIYYLSISALVLTLIFGFLLRYFTFIMTYLVLFVSSIGSIGLTGFLWYKYYEIKKAAITGLHSIPLLALEVDEDKAYLAYAIIATIFTVCFFFNYSLINLKCQF
jgi:hypothetical protein